MIISERAAENFWERFKYPQDASDPDACWIWQGAHNASGCGLYGVRTRGVTQTKTWMIHRLAWALANNIEVNDPEVIVSHRQGCPNACGRPDHLSTNTRRRYRHDGAVNREIDISRWFAEGVRLGLLDANHRIIDDA